MKRLCAILLLAVLLAGCGAQHKQQQAENQPLWNIAWITDTQALDCEWITALVDVLKKNKPKMIIHTGDARFEWANVCAWVDTNDSPAVTLAVSLAQWADDRPWPGRTGATDHAAYLAHLEIVERCGRSEYAASCRELGELAPRLRTAALRRHSRGPHGPALHAKKSRRSGCGCPLGLRGPPAKPDGRGRLRLLP